MRSKRRGKGSASHQLLTPMELGLVPAKYLKKNKAKTTQSQTTPLTHSTPPTPAATPHEMILEPRILFEQSLVLSSSPPTTTKTMGLSSEKEEEKDKSNSSTNIPTNNNKEQQKQKQQQQQQHAMDQLDALLGKRGLRSSSTSSQFLQDWKRTILRVEGWNVNPAVSRCLHHWRIKAQLWGTPDLKTTILRDVAPNWVHAGSIQLVPMRDAQQRAIVCVQFSPRLYATHEREIQKYLFYMLATALEDVATQDYGISLVVWNTQGIETEHDSISPLSNLLWSPRPSKLTSFLDSFFSLWRSMIHPAFSIATLHYCCLQNDADFSHESWQDKETTIHQYTSQSIQECLHALLSAGIPIEALPMRRNEEEDDANDPNDNEQEDLGTTSSFFDTTRHRIWVEWRQRTDSYTLPSSSHSPPLILLPRRTDILWGGYGGNNHSSSSSSRMPPNPGNIKYHQALLERLDDYMALTTTTTTKTKTKSAAVAACRDIYQEQQLGHVKCLQALDVQRGILWEEIQDEERIVQHIYHAMEYLADWKRQAMAVVGQDGTATTSRSSKHYTSNVDWEEWLPECCTVLCSPPPPSSSSSSRFCQTSWNTPTAHNNHQDFFASTSMTTSSGGQSVGSLHSAWGY